MGFLDQSTNNIIIDAVLTAVGRELLCKNDGSFVEGSGVQSGQKKLKKILP